jgi:spermidine/putrescine-binding protein
MKRILTLIMTLVSVVFLSGCNKGPVLYILNWNEYMSDELIAQFEELYDITVRVDKADSNESMYTKIKAKSTKYDIAIPSDYMIHKLYSENLLKELNYDYLPNYATEKFDPKLEEIRNGYFQGNQKYAVPYFWGTLGIMYNKSKAGVEDMVKLNNWQVFFDKELTGDAKIGMYDSSRDAIAAAELYLGIGLNSKSMTELKEVEDLLKKQKYSIWGTDDLKTFVSNGNLDIALVYSGDFFDMLYATLEDKAEVTYDLFVPEVNNVWFDAMVIPTTSTDIVMAHNFINFMIDPDNAYLNATTIGYCPPLTAAYVKMQEDPDYADIIKNYAYYPGIVTDEWVYEDLGTEIYQQMEIIISNVKS